MAKTVEISEEDFLRNQQLAKTVATLLGNPKAKELVQRAVKLVDPNAATPELDQKTMIEQAVAAATKKTDDFIAEQKAAQEKAEADRRIAQLQQTHDAGIAELRRSGWTDEGIEGVKKVMQEKGLLDPLDAAIIFEKSHPPQSPVTPGGSGAWDFMSLPKDGDDDLKKLVESKGENAQLLDKMAYDALAEVRGQTRR
jgi:hypothetical protein